MSNDLMENYDYANIVSVIEEKVKDLQGTDKRCWNLENDPEIGFDICQIFEKSLNEARKYYKTDTLHYSVMGNRVVKDKFGSGGGWHQDTRLKPQKKWFLYLNDVDVADHGPTQFLNAWQSVIVKMLEMVLFNFSNRVKSQFSIYLCNRWGRFALHKKGEIFSADTRLVHRGTPIQDKSFIRYALTLYVYGRHRPDNMQLTKKKISC